ncbi:hypothetical protein JRQ81_012355 [Phrynocephalus forsythii]|uniref:Uncharacterized protein n=1 Tax=Phrynocephalus forsythii TaxID=171643 RepID=A0A9Q1AQE0_9SAUR|nr:hypothetical protein JRQ81_012355 [Phrynocephalus forsythii]
MVQLTMISRVHDGLLLAASMQDTEQSKRKAGQHRALSFTVKPELPRIPQSSQAAFPEAWGTFAKPVLLGSRSHDFPLPDQPRCLLPDPVRGFLLQKLAFSFLEELQAEFWELYGKKVSSVSRPYAFIEFDIYIQKLKKSYLDTWSKRHLSSINTELQDVQKIMVTNIEEVLQRGEALSALDTKASNLSTLSKKYRQDAKFLNSRSAYAKAAATSLIFMVLMLYLRFWWLV